MRRILVIAGTLLASTAAAAASPDSEGAPVIRTWAYWLSDIDPARIAGTGYDLVVVDYSRDGSDAGRFSPAEVALMRAGPVGKTVLAYMSIGEAEDYRYYWKKAWQKAPPPWLDRENPEWKGNYKVRYWEPDWQQVIFGAPESYLDRIIAAGFDGVYLDIIDAFEYYEPTRPTAGREMVAFVARLSAYAKEKAGASFLVFGQNAERLVEHPEYLSAIDGIAKEDLFYGYEKDGAPSPTEEIDYSLKYLRAARAAGKYVLTVDYVSDSDKVADAYTRSRSHGFVPYASVRELDRLVIHPGLDPPASQSGVSIEGRRTPGQFFATTAPRGYVRLRTSGEYWRERYPYEWQDSGGSVVSFEARRFSERTGAVSLTYGLTDRWEVGFLVPVVAARFERDPRDAISDRRARESDGGLGSLRLLVTHGRSWNEESSNLLVELEVGVPTDTRAENFRAAGDARLALTLEHYWQRFGLIGTVAGSHFGEEGFSGGERVFEYRLGVGFQLAERLFASLLAGEDGQDARLEMTAEILLSDKVSFEFGGGRDLRGPAAARFFGAGLNFWLGAPPAAAPRAGRARPAAIGQRSP